MKKAIYHSLFGAMFLIASSNLYAASTVMFMTTVDPMGGSSGFATGLSKFDPSLGTLTAITLTAENGEFSGDIIPFGSVENFDLSHEVDLDILYQGSISINDPMGGGLLTTVDGYTYNASCFGDAFEDVCTDFVDTSVSGTYNASSADDFTPVLDRVIADGLLDEFVGPGNISDDLLEVGIFTFSNGFDVLFADNYEFDDFFAEIELGVTKVTIEYEFTPIPVPAAVWLFGFCFTRCCWILKTKAVYLIQSHLRCFINGLTVEAVLL